MESFHILLPVALLARHGRESHIMQPCGAVCPIFSPPRTSPLLHTVFRTGSRFPYHKPFCYKHLINFMSPTSGTVVGELQWYFLYPISQYLCLIYCKYIFNYMEKMSNEWKYKQTDHLRWNLRVINALIRAARGKRQINRCSLWVSWGYSNKEPQTRRLTREISSLTFWRLSLK